MLPFLLVLTFNLSISEAADWIGENPRRGSVPGQSGSSNMTGTPGRPCAIRNLECVNSGSHVQIDLAAQCMCVGSTCFEVAIGKFGPNQTRNGTGTIGTAPGSRYRTTRETTNTWSTDAVSMGIPENTSPVQIPGQRGPVTMGGKWIHKAGNYSAGECVTPATKKSTAGCVSVACEDWHHVKGAMGQQLTVCGGARTNEEIISVTGCNLRRYCPDTDRNPVYGGCARAVGIAEARGQTGVRCVPSDGSPASAFPRSNQNDFRNSIRGGSVN